MEGYRLLGTSEKNGYKATVYQEITTPEIAEENRRKIEDAFHQAYLKLINS